jgi:hypothetical protein
MVFGFGLVHGLGLATRFQELAVPHDGLVSRLLAFNVGIEFGQFLVVYLLYLFGEMLAWRAQWARIEQAGYAVARRRRPGAEHRSDRGPPLIFRYRCRATRRWHGTSQGVTASAGR